MLSLAQPAINKFIIPQLLLSQIGSRLPENSNKKNWTLANCAIIGRYKKTAEYQWSNHQFKGTNQILTWFKLMARETLQRRSKFQDDDFNIFP